MAFLKDKVKPSKLLRQTRFSYVGYSSAYESTLTGLHKNPVLHYIQSNIRSLDDLKFRWKTARKWDIIPLILPLLEVGHIPFSRC